MDTGNSKEPEEEKWVINTDTYLQEKQQLIAEKIEYETELNNECNQIINTLVKSAKEKLSNGDYKTRSDTDIMLLHLGKKAPNNDTNKIIKIDLMAYVSDCTIRYEIKSYITKSVLNTVASGLKIDPSKITITHESWDKYDGSIFPFDHNDDICIYLAWCCIPIIVNLGTNLFHIAKGTYKDSCRISLNISL